MKRSQIYTYLPAFRSIILAQHVHNICLENSGTGPYWLVEQGQKQKWKTYKIHNIYYRHFHHHCHTQASLLRRLIQTNSNISSICVYLWDTRTPSPVPTRTQTCTARRHKIHCSRRSCTPPPRRGSPRHGTRRSGISSRTLISYTHTSSMK